jgi:hypothetical protein
VSCSLSLTETSRSTPNSQEWRGNHIKLDPALDDDEHRVAGLAGAEQHLTRLSVKDKAGQKIVLHTPTAGEFFGDVDIP